MSHLPSGMPHGEQSPGTIGDRSPTMSRFLLVGSERSGSTMLRLMLDHHEQISCMYESDFMVDHYERYARRSLSDLEKLLQEDWHFVHSELRFPADATTYEDVIDGFFRQRHSATRKPVIGATIHRRFHHLPELFPETNIIHLLRDGRAVAASIVQMGWAGNVYMAARRWRCAIAQVWVLQQRMPSERWLEVRYEDLLADVPGKLSEICTFLGVPYSSRMLEYAQDTTYDYPDPANAQRWQRRLTPREIQYVEMAAGETLERSGYARRFPPVCPSRVERLTQRIDGRIRRALFRFRRYGAHLLISRKLWRLIGVRRTALEARYRAITEAHIR